MSRAHGSARATVFTDLLSITLETVNENIFQFPVFNGSTWWT